MEKEPSPVQIINEIRFKLRGANTFVGKGCKQLCPYPTPEEIEAYKKALKELEKEIENESSVTLS